MSPAVAWQLRPEPGWQAVLAEWFAAHARRRACWSLVTEDAACFSFVGRVPARGQWLTPDDPCLLVWPGTTDGTHVLAVMAIHLRVRDGCFYLARRKWYADEDLDEVRLGAGPLEMTLTLLEE